MNWDDYRFVLCVGRCAGLAAAARKMSISHSTAHRRLEAIEKRIGVKLFERLAHGYSLTAHGHVMASAGEAIERTVMAAERAVVGTDERLSGTIRVSTSELVAVYLMPEMLTRFMQRNSDVTVVTTVAGNLSELSSKDADIVIWATARPPPHMVGRKVSQIPYRAYAHRDLAERNHQRSLSAYDWIAYDNHDPHCPLTSWLQEVASVDDCRIRFDSMAAIREAVSRGMGAAVLPCFTGDQIADVLPIGEIRTDPRFHLWLLTHRELRRNARISAFMNYMATLLQASPYISATGPDEADS
jgi:DNA-binding transcriptional LysR family regulator